MCNLTELFKNIKWNNTREAFSTMPVTSKYPEYDDWPCSGDCNPHEAKCRICVVKTELLNSGTVVHRDIWMCRELTSQISGAFILLDK